MSDCKFKLHSFNTKNSGDKLLSLNDILIRDWIGKHYYTINKTDEKVTIIEVEIKLVQFEQRECRLLAIRNISYLL